MKQQNGMMNLHDILLDSGEKHQGFIQQYKPLRILGKGAFSTVIEALNMSSKLVAIKIIDKVHFTSQQIEILRQEAQLLIKLNHANIVRVSFSKETKNKLFIIMDLINGVTLSQYQRNQLDNETVVCITRQMLEAIQYLHQQDIIHRDIKPENIMIDPENLHVTLIDFGLSAQLAHIDGSGLMSENCGTILYMAPEQIQKKKYNRSIDIWALGIVVFNLLNKGKHPFFQQMDDISSYSEKITWMKWNWNSEINQKAMSFLLKTIAYHPEDRLNVDQCLEHPWITGKNDQPLTFIEILKAHTISYNIKLLIKALSFLQYLKKTSPILTPPIKNLSKYPTTPVEKQQFRLSRNPRTKSKNASNSGDKAQKLSNADTASIGSNKVSQFKVSIKEQRRERNSCDQLKKITSTQKKEQLLLPTLHRSLDRTIKKYQTNLPVTDNSLNQSKLLESSIFLRSKSQFNKDTVKKVSIPQSKNVNQISTNLNQPQQELSTTRRIRSSKPPLQKRSNVE
ncbi:unnamed protein product [Paramecium octaurelia]|uniref:Protein kinase domain-containing protein n=1 Tax=Paramecium octaurelia TaxID=43137 RepID=A0A8S1WV38_PAROT|nr:unnamed protein product [Paramecium octaurelia]